MKWFECCHCKQDKKEDDFFRDKYRPSGRKPRCKKCEKLYLDKDKRKIYEGEYRKKHPEKRSKILAKYYQKNKDQHKAIQDKYRQTEAFKSNHRKHTTARRARMNNAFIEHVDYQEIYNSAKGLCFYCGIKLEYKEAEFDHYIPLAKGGLHEKKNIRCSCMFCNRSKGAKMPEEVNHQMV